MFDQPTCFVSGSLAACLRITRFVGLAPIRFKKQGNGWRINLSTQLSVLGYFFMTVSWLTLLATVFLAMKHQDLSFQRAWSRRVVWIVDVMIEIATIGSMIYGAPRHIRCIITNLSRLQEINLKLNALHWPSELKIKQILLFIFWISIHIVLLGIDFIMLVSGMELPQEYGWIRVTYMSYYVFYVIIQLGLIQFMLIVRHICSTFKIINDSLERLLQEIANSTKLQRETIHTEVSTYVLACDVVREVDSSYGLTLFILLASVFLHLVTTPYYFIENLILISNGGLELTYFNEIMQASWCFLHIISMMILIEPCHVSHCEMKKTGELVSRLMLHPRSSYDPLAMELEQFSAQHGLNDITYSPMNIITMERSLVLAILASVVTYLFVLIGMQ